MTLLKRALRNPAGYLRRALDPRYVGFKLAQLLDEHGARRGLDRLRAYHRSGAGAFEGDRAALLARIVEYASRHVPYYRETFDRVGLKKGSLDRFAELPLLDKTTIRERRADLVSDELAHLPHSAMNTGGSTGEPLEFVTTGTTELAHQRFLFREMGWTEGDLIIALDGTQIPDERRARNIYWATKSKTDLPYGRLAFSSLYLGDSTIGKYVEQLLQLQPRILRGYPSFAGDLATYVLRKGLASQFRLKAIQLTSENAFADQVQRIKEAFGVPIYFQYGHSEGAVFGYTIDESRAYYCSPFYGYAEVLKPTGERAAAGETGEVVVTGFGNLAMPLIRYRTGDIAVYGGDDRGVVRLDQVVGRTQDFVFAADGRRVALTALIFGCHYKAFANIRKWQIVQDEPGRVTILVVRDEGYSARDESEIQDSFQRIAGIATDVRHVEAIPVTPRGKSKMLVQRVATP